ADEFSVRQDCSDRDIKQLIPLKTNLGIRLTPSLGWLPGELMLNFNWAYNSDYKINLANGPDIIQPRELSLYNGRIQWTDGSGRWRLSVEGRNLADKKYWDGSQVISNPIRPGLRVNAGD